MRGQEEMLCRKFQSTNCTNTNMKTAITVGLVLTVAVCLATTVKASVVTVTIPGTYNTAEAQAFDNPFAEFTYVIPNGDVITSATLQLNGFQAGFLNSSGQSIVTFSINGDALGIFTLVPSSSYDLQFSIPSEDLSDLTGGTAIVAWDTFPDNIFTGFPTAVADSSATLTLNVCPVIPEPTTFVAGALLLIPLGVGAARRLRGIKS
jgi:hypothetical protein